MKCFDGANISIDNDTIIATRSQWIGYMQYIFFF